MKIYNVIYTVGTEIFVRENLTDIWEGWEEVKAYAEKHPNEQILRKVQVIESKGWEIYYNGIFC